MIKRIILLIFLCMLTGQQALGEEYRSNIKSSSASPSGNEPLAGATYWDPVQLKDISLQWKPRQSLSSLDPVYTITFRSQRIVVVQFNDTRKEPSAIGNNIEKKWRNFNLNVTTKDSVSKWLTDKFTQLLNASNIQTVKDNGTLYIEADVLKFYVTEENMYNADTALHIKIKTPNGKALWEGMIEGISKRFGKSYKEENYHESLSDAYVNLVINFLKNGQVQEVVRSIR